MPARAPGHTLALSRFQISCHASEGGCNTLPAHRCRPIRRARNSVYEAIRLRLYRRGWCPCPGTLVWIWCVTLTLPRIPQAHYSERNVGPDQGSPSAHKTGSAANWVPWPCWWILVCVPTVDLSVAIVHRALAHLLYPISDQVRFWGWTENQREIDMDFAELSKLAKEGKPLYGETTETPYNQGVAFRNSVFSQLKLGQSSLSFHSRRWKC